jgi:hypothetical protein
MRRKQNLHDSCRHTSPNCRKSSAHLSTRNPSGNGRIELDRRRMQTNAQNSHQK